MTFLVRTATALLFLAFVIGGPSTLAQELQRDGNRFVQVTTKSFEVGPGGTLDISTKGGPVSVVGSDRSNVEVKETIRVRASRQSSAESAIADTEITYEVNGSTLSIRTPDGWGRSGVSLGFEVLVPKRFTVTASTAGGPVSIDNIEGRVEGATSGGPVSVEDITGDADVKTSGGPVSLDNVTGEATARTSGGPISAESIGGPLDAKTSGGPISVEDVGGDTRIESSGGGLSAVNVRGSLYARTAGGNIEVDGATGDVEARTSGGDIEVASIGGSLIAKTAGGDIEGRQIDGSVEATTRAGDIELEAVGGSVDAETSVGDIEIQMLASGSDDSSLRTSHGDVELLLPGNVAARLDIEVSSDWGGRIDRDDITSDFPITIETDRNGDLLRASGTLNGGGPTVVIRTRGGSVNIRKIP